MDHFRFILIVFFLSNALITYGQDKPEIKILRNSIHLSGSTLLYVGMYSLSYERTIYRGNYLKVSAAAGMGGWYLALGPNKIYNGYSMPLYFSTLLGRRSNHFEIDLGFRYTFFTRRSDKDLTPYYPELNLGYRFQRLDGKGIFFRSFIGLSGIGIGLGKAF